MKNYFLGISIVLLGIAIVISSTIVSNALIDQETKVIIEESKNPDIKLEKQLLTQAELGDYLGISDDEVYKMLPQTYENVTTSIIPYIKIGNKYYFPKKAIDKWLLESEATSFQ